jgi:hypothetical protein
MSSQSRSRSPESAAREMMKQGRKKAAALHEALERVKAAEAALKEAKNAFNAEDEEEGPAAATIRRRKNGKMPVLMVLAKLEQELKDAEKAVEKAGAAWNGGGRRRLTRRKRKGTRRH